jgi:lysophospholipase L1-like esterase
VTRDICRGGTYANDPTCLDNGRKVDFLIISGGGNDIGFSSIIKDCIVDDDCHVNNAILNNLNSAFSLLPGKYDQLASDINRRFKVSNVFITEYPDPTHNENGNYCERILGGIGHNELQWASRSVLKRLNQAAQDAANRNGWTYIDNIASQFQTHGYCAGDDQRWFRTIEDSRVIQGPFCCPWESTGTMHPNIPGHLVYKNRLLEEMRETPVPMPLNRLSLTVNPSTIIAKLPTSVTVYAQDLQTPVNGSVLVDNIVVGYTNVPFTYTFDRSSVSAKVVAPNYLETPIGFNINNKLDVTAIPNIVDLSYGGPINITISAISPATGQPIEGKVLTNEGGRRFGTGFHRTYNEIGPTNVPFSHGFGPHEEGSALGGTLWFSAPEVIVAAPTYDDTQVQIQFINIPEPYIEPPDDGPPDDGPCEPLSPTERRPECR